MSDEERRSTAARASPFGGATPSAVAGMTGIGVTGPAARGLSFAVAPAEAFCQGAGPRVGGAPTRAILELEERGLHAAPPRAGAATIEHRLPPRGWRGGVPLPAAMVREEHLFVVPWGGVAPVSDCHGDVGLLDPDSLFSDCGGARLPDAPALAGAAGPMLQELPALAATMSVDARLRLRIAQIAGRAGVGSPAGIRLRLGLTHVQWPLLVGGSEESLTGAFDRLLARGWLLMDGRSLIVPWDAWPVYARAEAGPAGGPWMEG